MFQPNLGRGGGGLRGPELSPRCLSFPELARALDAYRGAEIETM